MKTRVIYSAIALTVVLSISGCGGGASPPIPPSPPGPAASYTVGGTVSNLSGSGLVLQDNLGDDLPVTASGNFSFSTALTTGTTYSVSVKTQPTSRSQTCTPTHASGPIAASNITNVAITCVTNTFTVGGTVNGLTGTLVLQNNGGNDLTLTTNGPFAFSTKVASGDSYNVSIKTINPLQPCTLVTQGFTTVGNGPATNVSVICSAATVACGDESGTVVTHASDISASETWAGDGTVHLITSTINILAPAIVTIQKCAIVKLKAGVELVVKGDPTGAGVAKLVATGDDLSTGAVFFKSADAQPWGRLRGYNQDSIIELNYAEISGGGNVIGSPQRSATISMTGASTLPDAVLKVNNVLITNMVGAGIYLSDAAFTSDSQNLFVDSSPDYPLALPAMALGSIPNGGYTGNTHNEALVVENANIFDNLTINTLLPIHFLTNTVNVVGRAPTFVQDLTLTLEAGVTLKFEPLSTASPTLITFGQIGQPTNRNAALKVNGTAQAPVTFTSAVANPAPGDWAGLWLATSDGSQLDHVIIEYAGGDASGSIGLLNCGPIGNMNQRARNIAPLIVGNNDANENISSTLITNSTFRNNTGNFAIDSLWGATSFGPALNATNVFGPGPTFCTQSKNQLTGGCVVLGIDQSGCLVP